MKRDEQEIWEDFHRIIDYIRPRLDGCIPVAFIAVPTHHIYPDGRVVIDTGEIRIIWPGEFPEDAKQPILAALASDQP